TGGQGAQFDAGFAGTRQPPEQDISAKRAATTASLRPSAPRHNRRGRSLLSDPNSPTIERGFGSRSSGGLMRQFRVALSFVPLAVAALAAQTTPSVPINEFTVPWG